MSKLIPSAMKWQLFIDLMTVIASEAEKLVRDFPDKMRFFGCISNRRTPGVKNINKDVKIEIEAIAITS